jgi:hypothetical protein
MKKSKYSFSYLSKALQVLLIKNLRIVRTALATESKETAVMLKTYIDYSQGKVSKEEMGNANKQFRNLLKTAGLGALAILPFSPVTIPLLVKLGEKVGIDILPPSIRDQIKD